MELKEIYDSVADKLQKTADVKFLFGSMIETKDKSIIPVCMIRYGFGGGHGEGPGIKKEDKEIEKPSGRGGGGGFQGNPLGVFEITEHSTRFVPVIPVKAILVTLTIWILTGILRSKKK